MLNLDPRHLLTLDRLDYPVKWRYFRHLISGGDPDSERVYRWHILKRTGGVEPRSWKDSIDDYLRGCEDLLKSMATNGFNGVPLRYGTNKLLIGGGAHRVSCAIALGCSIDATPRPKEGRMTWGEDWFRQRGASEVDMARIRDDLGRMAA